MSDTSPSTETAGGSFGSAVPLPDSKTWPKNPSGTVDWDSVFEHPETGLVGFITRADSPFALRQTALAIIRQLFSRKGDEVETARLSAELSEIVADGMAPEHLPVVADAIVQTLRGIKEFRLKKAAEYEREQAEKEALKKAGKVPTETERRKEAQAQQSIKKALARKKKLRLMAIVGIVVAVVGGAVGGYFLLRPTPLPDRADLILLQQMKNAATGIMVPTHVYGGALRSRRYLGDVSITAENIPLEACVTLGIGLTNSGTFSVNGEALGFAGEKEATALCKKASPPLRATWVPLR